MMVGSVAVLVAGRERWLRGLVLRAQKLLRAARRRAWLLVGFYLLLSHGAAAATLWHTSWPGFLAWKLGITAQWEEFDRFYRNRSAKLRRFAGAIEPGAALFIGDSLLGSVDVGGLADHAVQLSISGDTARRVAARIRDYALVQQTRVVVLHVGTNDLRYRRPAAIEGPFQRLLGEVPTGVPVIVSAILPVDERAFHRYGNAQIAAANQVLAHVCEARPGCRFVDTGATLIDTAGNLDRRYHEPGEGLHLNALGVRTWQRALEPVLAPWRTPDSGYLPG
jgi:lysophospholipase L1-like esterase